MRTKTVLSEFSKGIKKSAALSFSRSASKNCDDICSQKGGDCYALRPESMYRAYGKKLNRHGRTKPFNLISLAKYEVSRKTISWFRFSVSGSIPSKNTLSKKDWAKLTNILGDFCSFLINRNIKIHFPVESMNKARSYRNILKDSVIVRRTIQDKRNLADFQDHCAYVVGDTPNPGNAALAIELAKIIRRRKKTVVVCPAIVGNSKCGKCTACAEPVDLILYPKH